MKKLYFLLFSILISSLSFGQTTVLQESFETDGNGSRYSTSVPEFTDGTGGDFFTRTDGTTTTVPSYYVVSGQDASYYFAAMDTDGDGNPKILTLNFTGIDISTYTNMTFVLLAAEDDASDGLEDWDADASVLVEIDIDGGGYTKLIQFSSGGATNTEPGLDTDFDGIADGITLNSTFQEFTASIGTGTSANIRITFTNLESGDEDIAIDNIRIIDGYVATPTLSLNDGPTNGDTLVGDPETINNANIDFATTNFVMSADAGGGVSDNSGDGYITWFVENTNGNVFVDGGDIFTSNDPLTTYPVSGLAVGETYYFEAELVDNAGASLSSPVVYSFTMTIATYTDVPDLATLRAQTVDPDLYYRVTGEVFNTYSRSSNNQKYFQDATGGILVHDPDFIISTTYSEGDGVTNMRGHLELYNGLFEFIPTDNDNWGTSSTGGTITPEVVTIADVESSLGTYESKLVRINNVTFADGDGINTFSSPTNYNINDGTATTPPSAFRTTFFEANYIGQTIPSGATNMLVIVGNFNGAEQFTARSISELTLATKKNEIQGFAMYPNPTSLGYVTIASKSNAKMSVAVFDMLGKQVLNKTVMNNKLDVASLTSGIYIMKVSQDNAISTTKLVID